MRKNGKTNAVGRGGALLRPAGYTELSKIFGESVCTYPRGRRGRCRSQPFATKERYGCGSAACRYTSARWEVANLPKTTIKSGAFCRADVGIGPYRVSANSYCPAGFKRKTFLTQLFKRNYLQICCTVTGGAQYSARRVSLCVRNN